MTPVPDDIAQALARLGLAPSGETLEGAPLTGGVSSDIWRVNLEGGPICAKRALAKLKVEADWRAPVERSIYEGRWLARAHAALPEAAPKVLGQDAETGVLALEWLDPSDHPTWKSLLLAGDVDPTVAATVGERLARIHGAAALIREPDLEDAFPTDDIFHAIRLEPYLLATARAWPAAASRLERLVEETWATKRCLVHGDVSPKNILVGPSGPIIIDAECAWVGDPAFDLAFCLNHLLLKRVARPEAAAALAESFEALAAAYLARVDWEAAAQLEARAARLLPALFLARVDGKSPAEYVTEEADKALIRETAAPLVMEPPARLEAVAARWAATAL